MILRDPVRPPTRWAPLLALTLLGLALPSWTRGQPAPAQDPAPPSEPPRAEAPRPAAPIEPQADPRPAAAPPSLTVQQIRDGMDARPWPSNSLAFRYVGSRRIKDLAARTTRVEVEVAAVTLGRGVTPDKSNEVWPQPNDRLGELSRLDVLAAGPQSMPGASESGPGVISKMRRFTAQTKGEAVTFGTLLDRTGPVPIRWLRASNMDDMDQADDLAGRLTNDESIPAGPEAATNPLGFATRGPVATERLRPTPVSLLDLAGTTRLLFLNAVTNRMDVVGTERIDGVDAVRVAWTAQPHNQPEIRGLCWVAPDLGFAVVRLEAVQAGGNTGRRQTWNRTATHFERVGDVWLPHQATWKTSVTPTQPSTTLHPVHAAEAEVIATFEDFRVNPPVTAETFHPSFPIEALDFGTGNFTAQPPAVPSGLADRLDQAIAASPFGPPRFEEPKAAPPAAANPEPDPAAKPEPVAATAPAPTPAVERSPAPVSAPTNVLKAQRATQAAEVTRAEAVRDKAQVELDNTLKLYERKSVGKNDVDLFRANLKIAEAGVTRERSRLAEFDAQLAPDDLAPARLNPAVLQARRDAQAAEVQKYQAQRDLAEAASQRQEALLQRHSSSKEELEQAQARARIAAAELSREQARLVEADALLAQAGSTRTDAPTLRAGAPASLGDWRDQVEWATLQREGKVEQAQRLRSKADLAIKNANRIKGLVDRSAIEPIQGEQAEAARRLAQGEADDADFAVREAELRLKQAQQRYEAERVRVQRQAERARDRLDWSRKMRTQGYVSQASFAADRAAYDDLMTQLDPKYIPEPEEPFQPGPPPPAAPAPAANSPQ